MSGAINRLKDIELKRRNGVGRDKEETLSDGGGLYARCQKGGFITWYFQYRQKGSEAKAVKVYFTVTRMWGLRSRESYGRSVGNGWREGKTRRQNTSADAQPARNR